MQHPTIRTLAGARAPASIDAARTALLVIDFQNEYFSGRLRFRTSRVHWAMRNA